jgi:hypothetical protein
VLRRLVLVAGQRCPLGHGCWVRSDRNPVHDGRF